MVTSIIAILSSYIITRVITGSSIFFRIREEIKKKTLYLQITDHPHFIECRLCVGFWISLAICIYYGTINEFFMVYGASYFLATQER